jgi:pilus assembly protein CpaE
VNAPWSPNRPGAAAREPFAAYVCDDLTADILRPVCIEQGWQVEKIHKGGLRSPFPQARTSCSLIFLNRAIL